MPKPFYRSCPSCEQYALRYTPEKCRPLTPADCRAILRTLATLCLDPNHIDLDGRARDPKNPSPVTFTLGNAVVY